MEIRIRFIYLFLLVEEIENFGMDKIEREEIDQYNMEYYRKRCGV